jgi:hypothetical protein
MIGKVIFGRRDGRISSGKLKRDVEKLLTDGKPIPKATFSSHLAQMLKPGSSTSKYRVSPVLKKEDFGRGKKIFYSLTDEARKRIAIGLLLRKIDSWKETAYLLLFYYLRHEYDPTRLPYDTIKKYEFKSEEELGSFLTRIHLLKQDFRNTNKTYSKVNARTDSIMTEPYQNVRISRTEYEDTGNVIYRYLLPGISPRDIIEGRKVDVTGSRAGYVFEHLFDQEVSGRQLTMVDLEELFDLLEKEDLISKINSFTMTYLGEKRYEVNPELRAFFKDCWDKLFSGGSLFRMMFTWRVFRRPRKEENGWYKMIWGRRRANSFFVAFNTRLRELKKNKKSHDATKKDFNEKYIQTYDESLLREYDSICKKYSDTTKKYPYPSNILLEIVYPSFLRMLNLQHKI